MIVVRVELWSAVTGKKTELARMEVFNDGTGTSARRNYGARTLRGRSSEQLDRHVVQRQGSLKDWPSNDVHIWNLIAAVLGRLGYGDHARRKEVEAAAIARGNEEGLLNL